MRYYRVTFSNTFSTVIHWDCIKSLEIVWDIFDCWYPSRDNIHISKIEDIGLEF